MEQTDIRLEKLRSLAELGIQAYPDRFSVTHAPGQVAELADGLQVRIAGRITGKRRMGKLTFAHLQDIQGRAQICLQYDNLGNAYQVFHQVTDLGDFLGVSGSVFTTKTGEKTVMVEEFTFLGKALREMPEKWHGLKDVEMRYRQRYLDLISNPDSRRVFLLRSRLLRGIRDFLEDRGFLEVETQILTNQPSGALASPFVTHHNALDIDLYLRIAPETYLKRLVVGGFTNVFEVARCFRNEGISAMHLQDFTMIEGYSAYLNYIDNMKLIQDMVMYLVRELFGSASVIIGEQVVDFSGDWPVVTFRDLILEDTGIDINDYPDSARLLAGIKAAGIQLEHENLTRLGKGNLVDVLYKKVSRPKLIRPTFLTAHPVELSPLARRNDDAPAISDRFQLLVNGAEIVNGYSELVDPLEQRARLEEQANLRSQGDEEAMPMDHDYLRAMEYGMPPISGWGLGVDRLLQVLLNLDNIRDGVLFPLMRPE